MPKMAMKSMATTMKAMKKANAMKARKTHRKRPAAGKSKGNDKASVSKAYSTSKADGKLTKKGQPSKASKRSPPMQIFKKPAKQEETFSRQDDLGRDIEEILSLARAEYDDMVQYNKSYGCPPSYTWKDFKKETVFQNGWRNRCKQWVWHRDWMSHEVLTEPGLRL